MATPKFGRNYSLVIEVSSGKEVNNTIEITPPFTIEFDVVRNILSSASAAQIRIYNLSKKNRDLIRFDYSNYGEIRTLKLRAGYGTNLPIIFTGNITQASSVREGTNFVTQIECLDGGYAFANGYTATSFPAETPQEVIIETLLSNLPGVSSGVIGSYPGSISRGNTYCGNTTDILKTLTGGGFFVDNLTGHCLGNSECLEGEIQVIDAASGLLGTPVREQTLVTFDILFEPRLIIGQKIILLSSTDANFNGEYKIISVKHRGMISESVCGEVITTASFFYGASSLNIVGTA